MFSRTSPSHSTFDGSGGRRPRLTSSEKMRHHHHDLGLGCRHTLGGGVPFDSDLDCHDGFDLFKLVDRGFIHAAGGFRLHSPGAAARV